MKKDVGYRIRKFREAMDYSQDNMAEDLKISVSAYSKIERGITDPSIGRLADIAKILEVNVIELLGQPIIQNKVEDKDKIYGYITKDELDDVNRRLKQISMEITFLKKEIATIKKPKARQKK